MASPARHLLLFALAAVLTLAAPRATDAWGSGRFFFSKTTRAEPAVEPEKPAAADPNAARPSSTPGSAGRGYGLYGRPEETYPPDYFRRGVHRNAEKLTTTTAAADVPATTTRAEEAAVPVQGGRTQKYPEDGSGRGRPQTNVPATTTTTDTEEEEEAVPVGSAGGDLEGVQPYPENGSGRGRPPWYYTAFRGGRRQQGQEQEEQRDYGMSDTRLYQNGRYYYDVDAGRYGYGRESNPMGMGTRPEEEEQQQLGSGYGRPGGGVAGGDRGRRYGNNAAAGYRQYGNGDEFGNGEVDQNQNGRYIP